MWNVALAEEFPYLRSMAKEVFVHMSPVETLHTNIYLDRIIIVRLVWGLKNVGSGAQTFLPHSLTGPPPTKALNWENRLECIRQSHRPTPHHQKGRVGRCPKKQRSWFGMAIALYYYALKANLPQWCWLNRVDCIRQIDAKDVACNMCIGTNVCLIQREDSIYYVLIDNRKINTCCTEEPIEFHIFCSKGWFLWTMVPRQLLNLDIIIRHFEILTETLKPGLDGNNVQFPHDTESAYR